MSNLTLFDSYLQSWNAQPDGEPFATHAGHLLPVRLDGHPDGRAGMIKIARHIDERVGGQVMRWWDGDGAARVYALDENAGVLLMERATGAGHLLKMALEGDDVAATSIVCRTIGRLHAKRPLPAPNGLLPLTCFFESLAPMARREGGLMAECAVVADELLGTQREWLRGATPWRSHVDFARFLSGALDCQVRCDPGSEHSEISPYSDVFLDVHRGVEKLVTWG
ncbi:hypothetical protein NWF24_06800 [Variovorax paradoxus]|uniref:aminoglycoside phosphotransferase family protein n=1 Tax=Variovorax paradoxus TaxID=34073 RepID=UPI0021AC0D05|nr:aminoglycoside phosphotransferase family protein [Variovorax paradoxus]UVH59113.1 hypothetical protein NWF24_06800 [Variovorax paradoxus]